MKLCLETWAARGRSDADARVAVEACVELLVEIAQRRERVLVHGWDGEWFVDVVRVMQRIPTAATEPTPEDAAEAPPGHDRSCK